MQNLMWNVNLMWKAYVPIKPTLSLNPLLLSELSSLKRQSKNIYRHRESQHYNLFQTLKNTFCISKSRHILYFSSLLKDYMAFAESGLQISFCQLTVWDKIYSPKSYAHKLFWCFSCYLSFIFSVTFSWSLFLAILSIGQYCFKTKWRTLNVNKWSHQGFKAQIIGILASIACLSHPLTPSGSNFCFLKIHFAFQTPSVCFKLSQSYLSGKRF